MKISIAMATYNGANFVSEQLESFRRQTRLPDELIITDDCSTDGTIDILNKFKDSAPFKVKIYINEANLGYTQNFNKSLELCTGDLIFLSDQDDVWFPTKIEHMLNLTVQFPDKDLFMVNAELTDVNLKKSGLTKQGQIRDLGMKDSTFVMGCCIAVKKRYIDLILPIPKNFLGHDDWIVNIADMLNIKYIDSSIQQYYRIHGNNTSTFIANTLVKMVKPKITLIEKFSMRLHFSKISFFNNFILKKRYFLFPLERLSKETDYSSAKDALVLVQNSIKIYEQRLLVLKSKNIVYRVFNALQLYFNGGYNAANGFKSCVSDIFRS